MTWIAAVLITVVVFASGHSTPRQHPQRKLVRFWHRWQGDWEKQVQKIVDAFNASQDKYEVVAVSVPGSGADAKFILGVIGGDPPDLMSMGSGAVPNMAANGFLTKLETFMTPEEKRRFFKESYPAIRDIGMYKGSCYGMTIGADLMALYVNVKQLREAGFDPDRFPTSLEELEAMGMKLNKYDEKGNLKRLGFLLSDLNYVSHYFGGGFYVHEDGKVELNTPQNRRALQAIVDYRKKLGFENVLRFQAGLNDIEGAASWAFMHGDLSVTYDGQWRVEELRKFKPELEYRVYPLPPPKDGGKPLGGTVGGNYMIVPVSAKEKLGAWEFLKFWTGLDEPDRAAKFYNMGGWLPYSPAVAKSPTFQKWLKGDKEFQAFLDILASPNCKAPPPIANLQFLNDLISRAEDQAVRGAVTPAAALEELESKFKEETAKRRALGYEE
ncbi:sugar ABC transporter substrate-binding protein [Fimbriimonas ginsengisoli Gsoil 348]|uniref:Sugar ABC transporter substrate-binding protein n=1 Tax=Fimbriimonas ginsengisoli Gsoil 348 TaxID=661478 RepID=A0A068NSG1_FIMGI|nr:sugar ABC transporter substrate-binding protein [Fimbriimonas ginsengisoli Gsoil 348]